MADIELKCCFCSETFDPGVLNELGKCPTCEVAYPKIKTLKEAMGFYFWLCNFTSWAFSKFI